MSIRHARSGAPSVTFLSHAVDRSGPPIYLLHLLGWLARNQPTSTRVISLRGGELAEEFRALTDLHIVGEPDAVPAPRGAGPLTRARNAWRGARIGAHDPDSAVYVNTAWSIRALRYLPGHRGPVIAHVHELDVGLDYHLEPRDRAALFSADRWVAASRAVADNLVERWGVREDDLVVHHEMIDSRAPDRVADHVVSELRASIGLPDQAVLVGTAAVLNWRKGPDLFAEVAATVLRSRPSVPVHFLWLGLDPDARETQDFLEGARRAGIGDRLHVVGVSDRPEAWMRAFDLFVLAAREDAYPLAGLEAAAASCPVICFEAGGMPEFVGHDAGAVIEFPDTGAMARAVYDLATDPRRRQQAAGVARRRVVERHDVSVSAPKLCEDLARWTP